MHVFAICLSTHGFFIRNRFIRNLLIDNLKCKKLLELQGKN